MARLTRVYQKVFASNASNNGVFGSLQAGNPTTSNNVATLQSLSAFENGWDDAAYSGDKLPPLEEFQGIQYGISYQQAYMLQEGIAEWETNTPYYKGSLVKTISGSSFKLYCSLADNNTGNIVTNTTYWKKVMDSDDLYALDSAVVHLSGTETITGNKTFSGSVSLGSSATVTTPPQADSSTRVANTAWVKSNMTGIPDYANRTEFTTAEYTPTAHGIIVVKATGSAPWAEISTNDNFVIARSKATDSSSGTQVVWAIVKSGDTYKTSGSGTVLRWFIPFA